MRKVKKTTAGVLLMVTLCMYSVGAYAAEADCDHMLGSISYQGNDLNAIIDEERNIYCNDAMFHVEAAEQGYTFEEYLMLKSVRIMQSRNRLGNINNASTYSVGNNGQNVYTNIALIKQTKTNNCGPTAALQVIYGLNKQSLVSGNTDADKINTLEQQCEMENSTIVYKLVNTLNLYTPDYGDYEYISGKSMTLAQFQGKVETSLAYNYAPILHARTEEIPYYEGYPSGHYIAVSEVDKANGTMTVKDCNYKDKYYGVHTEYISEFYDSINAKDGRYLICLEY